MLPICTDLCLDQFPDKLRSVRKDSLDTGTCSKSANLRRSSLFYYFSVFVFLCYVNLLEGLMCCCAPSISYSVMLMCGAPQSEGPRAEGGTDLPRIFATYRNVFTCMAVLPTSLVSSPVICFVFHIK
jgi:hypothetical protein